MLERARVCLCVPFMDSVGSSCDFSLDLLSEIQLDINTVTTNKGTDPDTVPVPGQLQDQIYREKNIKRDKFLACENRHNLQPIVPETTLELNMKLKV